MNVDILEEYYKLKTASNTDLEFIFDGPEVKSVWYNPKLEKVLCSLCGKGCKVRCHRVNPWCG
jgi:hypothetical protein